MKKKKRGAKVSESSMSGLQHCLLYGGDCNGKKMALPCPYRDTEGCRSTLYMDEMRRVKTPVPMVIPHESGGRISNGTVVWVEERHNGESHVFPMMVSEDADGKKWVVGPYSTLKMEHFSSKCRKCWTAKPTEEQRKAEPWEYKDHDNGE